MWEEIRQRLETPGGVIQLVGPHGAGKTFFLLFLGHWWEAQGKYKPRAYYARTPAVLDPQQVKKQWESVGRSRARRCLWIIDDAHTDHEGILYELMMTFDNLALPNHWLITAGWSSPKGNIESIDFTLTRDTIVCALQNVKTEVATELAEDSELIDMLVGSPVGLRQIIWAVHEQPELLKDRQISALKDRWIKYIMENIPAELEELVRILARLKFLGLLFVTRSPEESEKLRRLVRSVGWIQPYDDSGFEILDEEIAQLILQREIGKAGDTRALALSFLNPLRPYVIELLRLGILTYPGRLLNALRFSSRQELINWVNADLSEDKTRLLKDFLNEDLLNTVYTTVHTTAVEHQKLANAVRTIATLRSFAPSWAREKANAILKAVDMTELLTLPAEPPDALAQWRSVAVLGYLTNNQKIRAFIEQTAEDKVIKVAFQQIDGVERGKTLDEAKRVSKKAYKALLKAYYQLLCKEIQGATPKGAWHRLSTFAKREQAMSVDLLKSLGPEAVANLLCAAPQAARGFLSKFPRGSDERERVKKLFTLALKSRTVSTEDIQHWTTLRDFNSLVFLARELPEWVDVKPMFEYAKHIAQAANPAVLVDVARDVAKYAEHTKLRDYLAECVLKSLEQGKEPFLERLKALAHLNIRLLKSKVNFIPRWKELNPGDIFAFLWLVVANDRGDPEPGRMLAREIINNWDLILSKQAPLTTLAIAGLCMFVLDNEFARDLSLPLDQLDEPLSQTTPPKSPSLTACQLLALAKKVSNLTDQGYSNLYWLVEHVAQPSKEYLKNWGRIPPTPRRWTLAVILTALRALMENGLDQLANKLAIGIASASQDKIWNSDINARLEAVLLGAGSEAALQMLKRCCIAWSAILQKIRHTEPRLQFLKRVVSLAVNGDTEAQVCVEKLLRAVELECPSERLDEIMALRKRLEGAIES